MGKLNGATLRLTAAGMTAAEFDLVPEVGVAVMVTGEESAQVPFRQLSIKCSPYFLLRRFDVVLRNPLLSANAVRPLVFAVSVPIRLTRAMALGESFMVGTIPPTRSAVRLFRGRRVRMVKARALGRAPVVLLPGTVTNAVLVHRTLYLLNASR